MVKVESKTTINTVVSRFMKVNRGRNLIAILAIVMTTVMFTALFTAAMSVVKSQQQHEMRSTMDSAHITIQMMTKEQLEAIQDYVRIQRSGVAIFAALAENKELRETQTEIRYGDENAAESFMCGPQKGRLPKSEGEIALSTITLNQLGVEPKLGNKVKLAYTLSGKKQVNEFVLSGYWTGDPLPKAQIAWVSKGFCLKQCKEATQDSLAKRDYEGEYSLNIWCGNIWKLTDYAEELSQELKGTPAKVSVNPAFERYIGEDGLPIGTLALILLIIFLSGYLIIFNVFRISVNQDIRTYGLLKSVGTTGRQLKIIVRRQALCLSAIGIPMGIAVGCLVGRTMVPYLLANVNDTSTDKVQALSYIHPWVLLLSAGFALCTVWIGCIRPCQAAASLSPIEAMRFSEQAPRKASRRTRTRISAGIMAVDNVGRAWRKSAAVILSLMLPIMVLNGAYTIVKGFDFDKFTEAYISSDFEVSGLTSDRGSSDLQAVGPDFLKEVSRNDHILSAACVYDTEMEHRLTDKGYANLKALLETAKAEGVLESPELTNEWELMETRKKPAHILGINKEAFDKMTFIGKSCTWEEFNAGGRTIIGPETMGLGSYYKKGETVTLDYEGKKTEAKVIAEGSVPYSLQFPYGAMTWFDYTFYVPEKEYQAMEGQQGAMIAGLEVKDGTEEKVDQWLKQYIETSRKPLYVNSRLEIKAACDGVVGKYYLILGSLCAVLFAIGVLNFFNTSAVSIMARSRELSLLEAVGMTKKQIRRMLIFEGILYLGAALLLADTLGTVAAKYMIGKTVGTYFYFQCHMSVLPSLLALPVLLAVAFAVPGYHYKRMCAKTIMERIRSI